MRITSYTNYALRLLTYCALKPGRFLPISEIAAAHQISSEHLTKAARALMCEGWLETLRGRRGGVRLAMPADEIDVGKVMRALEGPCDPSSCFAAMPPACPWSGGCPMKDALAAARDAFFATLDGTTIADLAANDDILRRRLSIADDAPAGDAGLEPHRHAG